MRVMRALLEEVRDDENLAERVLDRLRGSAAEANDAGRLRAGLPLRAARGLSDQLIAAQPHVPEAVGKRHLANIHEKIGECSSVL
jgi:hypothetical protein